MKFTFNNQEYYIDGYLASALDTIVYNVRSDWDFVILITGDRTVRTGKSVLAMTVCAYISHALNKLKLKSEYTLDDVYFDNKKMMDIVQKKPKYSINHYDEAREGLSVSKIMMYFQQDLLDFFAECGQLNHIWVIVAPDFFDLRETMAVARSEFLLNVYRSEENKMTDMYRDGTKRAIVKFNRGFFQFFNKKTKQELYDRARSMRKKNYSLKKANFIGRFTNQYTLPRLEYLAQKRAVLKRFKERHHQQMPTARSDVIRNKIIYKLHESGMNGRQISDELKTNYDYHITSRYINQIIQRNAAKT